MEANATTLIKELIHRSHKGLDVYPSVYKALRASANYRDFACSLRMLSEQAPYDLHCVIVMSEEDDKKLHNALKVCTSNNKKKNPMKAKMIAFEIWHSEFREVQKILKEESGGLDLTF